MNTLAISRIRHQLFLCGVVIVAASCAAGTRPHQPLADGLIASDVAVRVTNHNWHDMRVYLLSESGRAPRRLGMVPSMSTAVFRIRDARLGTMWFQLRPLGTRATYSTNRVLVGPGQVMELRVENSLPQSMLIVR